MTGSRNTAKLVSSCLLCLLLSLYAVTTAPASQARVQKVEGSAPLTQEEINDLNEMEKEWAANIDNAVSRMRSSDRSGTRAYIEKANGVIARMKGLLVTKGYIIDSVDRMVAMDRLTEAYGNMARIADYVSDAGSLIANAGSVRAIFDDTRRKLGEAHDKFHEVPALQELCKRFIGVLDEFERDMRRIISQASR